MIKTDKKIGKELKQKDKNIITISKEKSIKTPDFIGMSKNIITNSCNILKINC